MFAKETPTELFERLSACAAAFMRAAIFALMLGGAAFAQDADNVPVPADGSNPREWLDAHISYTGWTVLGIDDVAIALGSPEGVTRFADGTLRAVVRHEYYAQRELGGNPMRSMLQTREVNCETRSNRIITITLYAHSNMQGPSVTRENANAGWTTPEGNSLYTTALNRICEAPTTGVRLN